MEPFFVNDLVVCIKDFTEKNLYVDSYPKKGYIYTIRDIFPGTDEKSKNHVYLRFQEIHNPKLIKNLETGFISLYFRKVKNTDISVFKKMIVNIPEKFRKKEETSIFLENIISDIDNKL